MNICIALAGNPNSGKTTLFNALTGSNQYVGNWPGVTVEKKEGKLKKHNDVVVVDLPGIYSLSPYTLEEVIARDYLIIQRPNVILNIIDATNLERNLYLTTQLTELGIPVIVALNMADIVKKNGDKINVNELSKKINCKVVEISALKKIGLNQVVDETLAIAKKRECNSTHKFSKTVESALEFIEKNVCADLPNDCKRWYTVKIFERDEKVLEELKTSKEIMNGIEAVIKSVEDELNDDAESIITNERYIYISSIIDICLKRKNVGQLTISDKIDKLVTSRWLGLPIFAVIMFFVYYVSMVSVGTVATDFVNDKIFDSGFHLFGNSEYAQAVEEFSSAQLIIDGYEAYTEENGKAPIDDFKYAVINEETLEVSYGTASVDDYEKALKVHNKYDGEVPNAEDYKRFVPSLPDIVEKILVKLNTAEWLKGLIIKGIVAGVGAVLGFIPQMFVLFFLLAFLESCGYMARIAFVLDRVFRKFGLSGKSFVPMLIGTGCGVPGIMASRTIENERDRRMTVMTTTFIPCGAKVPFISMIAGAIFGGSALVATSAYFIGMAAIIISGIILKKTKMFCGETGVFVMELPAYHLPTVKNLLNSTWERGRSFIKKAGTIILISTIAVWFMTFFGFVDGSFRMLSENELEFSVLALIGSSVAWIFKPLGFGTWEATVASITGLVAKENIVGTMGILYGANGDVYATLSRVFNGISGYSFLVFNLLCAPCFAAMGAIKREMNSGKWTCFAILYQCGFAYSVSFMINQFGRLISGNANVIGSVVAFIILALMLYMLFRPAKNRAEIN